MPHLITESYKKHYFADVCSCAWIFCISVWAIILILPFMIAFGNAGFFWTIIKDGYEQPSIRFRNEAILYTYESGNTFAYSTVQALNQKYTNPVVSPTFKNTPYDSNDDGIIDKFDFEFDFFSTCANLERVSILLFFDYGFSSITKLQMIDFVSIDLSSSVGISGAYVWGDIDFQQKDPIRASSTARVLYNVSYLDQAYASQNFNDMIAAKFARNDTLKADYEYYVTQGTSNTKAKIQIQLTVPVRQQILYVPTILENLKFSWIQYLSLFIPLYFIATEFLSFTYRNRIFPTQESLHIPILKKKKQ